MAASDSVGSEDPTVAPDGAPASPSGLEDAVSGLFWPFFRNREVSDALKRLVFPRILARKSENAPIRMWVAGCATGEPVYSLALSLLEFLGEGSRARRIQIFGTDPSEGSIATARAGVYSDAAIGDLGEDRRQRYFTSTHAGFHINERVRNLCYFVRHDLARDPPFAKVDLVSCRALATGVDRSQLEGVLTRFHHSLNNPGFLVLDGAEGSSSREPLAWLGEESQIFARVSGSGRRAEDQDWGSDEVSAADVIFAAASDNLPSLDQELETAREHLQAVNEELTTVNDELATRIREGAESKHDLVTVLNAVDVIPLVILDKERRIVRFTSPMQKYLNLLPSDLGRPFGDIQPNIDAPDLDQQVAEVLATSVSREGEVRDRGGGWFRLVIRPYPTNEGVGGVIVSLLDIQNFKHHLTEVQRAKDDAERADRAKDQFLAVLSHELRTPLSSLLMQAQLLRQAGSDAARRDRACEAVERSTRIQMKLVDDLLDVSRIMTGKLRVDLQPCDLAEAVQSALDQVAALLSRKSIELSVSLDRSLGVVAGDRTRLEQVVLNLVGNAIKFTPSGGKITVSLARSAGLAHLLVSDTGMGIEPDFLPHVFERLSQSDVGARCHSGLGLGLAIVRHIVDAHGGTVRAESAGPDKGATFRVVLPLISSGPIVVRDTSPSSGAREPGGRAIAGLLAGRRILLVEDDVGLRDALSEALALTGAIVEIAESAALGMAAFRRFRPEAILCDIAMPGEDGYAFIGRIRALSAARGGDTPALALTALAGATDRRRALAAGFQMYLAKPIDVSHLAETVVQLLPAAPTTRMPRSRREQSRHPRQRKRV